MNTINEEKLTEYIKITESALKEIKIAKEKTINWKEKADEFLDMAQRYFSDAKHYREKGDFVTAFAAINYAHGWLDAGARLGLFDVKDKRYFAVD